MKNYYLITAMDKLGGNVYHPNPCLFETIEEVCGYIITNNTDTLTHCYKQVSVGKMKSKGNMKTLAMNAGLHKGLTTKLDVQDSEARYWGTCHNTRFDKDLNAMVPVRFTRSDGSRSTDKTRGWHSRPGQKLVRRNANRAITKRARVILKRQITKDLDEV